MSKLFCIFNFLSSKKLFLENFAIFSGLSGFKPLRLGFVWVYLGRLGFGGNSSFFSSVFSFFEDIEGREVIFFFFIFFFSFSSFSALISSVSLPIYFINSLFLLKDLVNN
jgi:hypothetical protein